MARRKREIARKEIGVDPIYGSDLVQKFINVVMERGKKHAARRIMYDAIEILVKKSNGDKGKAIDFFNKAFWQVVPAVEVRSRRVGGSVYQIPREVSNSRGRALAMRWLIEASQGRPGRTMGIRLANELLDAAEGRGAAVKKKLDVHRMAEANRAFSHYAW
ncbi:MAG TPA: 30S ribosomal protein S7 [Candidatus Babeliales bacterium]|nr:30S ribosomal protein S7 [Candidatus Babeliales bacterium]